MLRKEIFDHVRQMDRRQFHFVADADELLNFLSVRKDIIDLIQFDTAVKTANTKAYFGRFTYLYFRDNEFVFYVIHGISFAPALDGTTVC